MRFLWAGGVFGLVGVAAATEAITSDRGYPLFFGSFEDVGETQINPEVLSLERVDHQVTEWLRGCHADAFVLVHDSSPLDIAELAPMKKIGQQSLTRGSFLSDYLLNVHELALDIEDYCKADLVIVDPASENIVEHYIDSRPRVFYVDFPLDAAERRKEVLTAILAVVPSPYVTIIYTSSYAQSRAPLRSLELDSRRLRWTGHGKHEPDKVQPVIAPLFSPLTPTQRGHAAPEPVVELPDHFFATLMIASFGTAAYWLARTLWRPIVEEERNPAQSKEKSKKLPLSDQDTLS